MMYTFIGEDGSLKLEKGKNYNVLVDKQDDKIFAYIEIEPYKTIICPYNNMELFLNNWAPSTILNVNLGNIRGLIRKLDRLGRIVIPKEFRDELNILQEDKIEIFLLKGGIYMKKS